MMDNKINFYGFETGVLLEKLDKEFDHYACNNKELNYGFYNENNGFFLEKDYKENLKYIRDYVAVSYTHLDVYKRQVQEQGLDMLCLIIINLHCH